MPIGFNTPGFGTYVASTGTDDDQYLPTDQGGRFAAPLQPLDPCTVKITNVPSPAFLTLIAGKKISPLRRLVVNGVDLSDRVLQWPSFRRDFGKLKPVAFTIRVSNADKTLNHFINSDTEFNKVVTLDYGINDPDCGDEYINLFTGSLDKTSQRDSVLSLGMIDKFKEFSDTRVGSDETPVDLRGGGLVLPDLLWELITTHGGLSTVLDATNPDVNYTAFTAWREAFVLDTVQAEGYYTGVSLTDIIAELAQISDSIFSFERGRLTMSRLDTTLPPDIVTLTDDDIIGNYVERDDKDITNVQTVRGGLDVVAGTYSISSTTTDAVSVVDFGTRESISEPKSSWLSTPSGVDNLSQRVVNRESRPIPEHELDSTLKVAHATLNSGIRFDDAQLDIVAADSVWRVSGVTYNVDSGETRIRVLPATSFVGFRLDNDIADASLGLLDHNHNVLL